MYLPKVLTGIIISGATITSMFFPSNSFAHKFVSDYVFPTMPPVPTMTIKSALPKKLIVPIVITSPIPSIPTPTPKTISTPVQSNTAISIHPQVEQQTPTTTFSHPTPTQTPQITQTQNTLSPTTDAQTFIMNAINDYRHSLGLSIVQTDSHTCAFAATRAQEITTNFSHDGFTSRVNNHTLPYPGYSYVTENLAQTGNYKDVVNMWIASPGHAENMRANTPYVCVVQNGEYFAYEGWRP